MTMNNPWDSPAMFDPEMYCTDGTAANIGGAYTVLPTVAYYAHQMSKEEYFRWEITAARRFGLDGFEFFYPHNMQDLTGEMRQYDANIRRFVSLVEDSQINFRFSLCLSHPKGVRSLDALISTLSVRIRSLLEHRPGSSAWLRTPDGRLVVKTFAFERAFRTWTHFYHGDVERSFEQAANLLHRIAAAVGERFAVVWHMRPFALLKSAAMEIGSDPFKYYARVAQAACRHFPAVTGFADVLYPDTEVAHEILSNSAEQFGTERIQAVFLDFFRAQLFLRDNSGSRRPHRPETYRSFSANDFYRWYIPSGGAAHVYRLFHRAADEGVRIARIITWNDYPEGHNLAPDLGHNFAFGVLVRDLKERWLGDEPQTEPDTVVVFAKRYDPNRVVPHPHRIEIRPPQHVLPRSVWQALLVEESEMTVYTSLTGPAELRVNERLIGSVPAGPALSRAPLEPGPIIVRVQRHGRTVAELRSEEWITDAPIRTDMNTYGFSSRFYDLYHDLFGTWETGVYYTERTYRNLADTSAVPMEQQK